MTADEFELAYAERSGLTVQQLRALGRMVAPCDCGGDGCEGWRSVNAEGARVVVSDTYLAARFTGMRVPG